MADLRLDRMASFRPFAASPIWAERGRWAILVLLVFMLLLGASLVGRRMVGALDRQLPSATLTLLAAGAAAAAAGLRTAWRRLDGTATEPSRVNAPSRNDLPPSYWTQFVGWGSSIALMLWAIGCSYPGRRPIEWVVWLPLLATDQFFRHAFLASPGWGADPELRRAEPTVPVRLAAGAPPGELDSGAPRRDSLTQDPSRESSDQRLMQELYRVREANGQDRIYGTVLADLEQGQRVAAVHVAFCPPLGLKPEVSAQPRDFPDVQVTVIQALAHGARIDVRLSEPAEEACTVPIEFSARSPLDRGLAL